MHCHISSHFVMGMGFYIVTSPDLLSPPPVAAMSCVANSLEESVVDVMPGNETGGNGTLPEQDTTSGGYGFGFDSFTLVMSLAVMGTVWFM